MTEGLPSVPPIRIMIVDDDAWVTRGLAAVLSRADGLSVHAVVNSGEAAVDAYRRDPADVVLMDVNMGSGMTGVEATRALIAMRSDARVLILTTTAPGPGLRRAIDAGALAAIDKNASAVALVSAIRDAAARVVKSPLAGNSGQSMRVAPASEGDAARGPAQEPLPELTDAEHRVLLLLCRGFTYEQVGAELVVAKSTVETHAKRLRQKLGVHSTAQLIVRALEYRFTAL